MASPFLSALASIGSQYAEGRTAGQEEKEKIAQEKARTALEQQQINQGQARLGLEQSQQDLAKQRLEFEKLQNAERLKQIAAQPDIIPVDMGKGRKLPWSVSQHRFLKPEELPGADPNVAGMKAVQAWINTMPKEDQPKLLQDAVSQAGVGADPSTVLNKVQALEKTLETARQKTIPSSTITPELLDSLTAGMPADLATRFKTRVSAELSAGAKNPSEVLEKQLKETDAEMTRRAKANPASKGELTAAASKIVATTLPTMQQVDRLVGDIDRLGLQANNQRGYLFMPRLNYMFGKASPQGTLASDIAGFSLGSVIEAGSALQGTSRSISALKLAMVHTPNPWVDSPMMMRQKLVEIRQRLQDMVNDAQKYGTKRGMAGVDTGAGATDMPIPITSGTTDVPTAPQSPLGGGAAGGGLSPAAQAVLDSYQKKQPPGRQ